MFVKPPEINVKHIFLVRMHSNPITLRTNATSRLSRNLFYFLFFSTFPPTFHTQGHLDLWQMNQYLINLSKIEKFILRKMVAVFGLDDHISNTLQKGLPARRFCYTLSMSAADISPLSILWSMSYLSPITCISSGRESIRCVGSSPPLLLRPSLDLRTKISQWTWYKLL